MLEWNGQGTDPGSCRGRIPGSCYIRRAAPAPFDGRGNSHARHRPPALAVCIRSLGVCNTFFLLVVLAVICDLVGG
jgi:hypothetical protein